MNLLKIIQRLFMAKIEHRPIPKDDKSAALEAIAAYKKQNPVKYELKKAALFARYGLDVIEDSADVVPDANDVELAKIKAKVTKAKK
jgi:hypothetical protein